MAKQYSKTVTIQIEDLELEVEGTFTPGSKPSGLSGPPENYDPGDGGWFSAEAVGVGGEDVLPMLEKLYIRRVKPDGKAEYVHFLTDVIEVKAAEKAQEEHEAPEECDE